MKLTADKHIPLIQTLFAPYFELNLLAPDEFTPANLKNADILLVRSVTRVDAALLKNTSIQLIGTASSGTDHLDTEWLNSNNISWLSAAGCNAQSVADYVVSCIARLRKENLLTQPHLRAGIVGVGHVGKLVAKQLNHLGFELLLNDPPRAATEKDFISTPLNQFTDLDLICLHTPLTHQTPYATYHLFDKNYLKLQKPGCVLLNAGRGAVINFSDLHQYGQHLHWCFDVWENEPTIHLDIFNKTKIATPHIAGHAIQSKWRAATMLYQQIAALFKLPPPSLTSIHSPAINFPNRKSTWEDRVLAIYDPLHDTELMRTQLSNTTAIADAFTQLRQQYPLRHELSYPALPSTNLSSADIKLLTKLGCHFQ